MLGIVGAWARQLLAEPLTRGLNLDDPQTTVLRRDLAKRKKSLALCNLDWYSQLAEFDKTAPKGVRLELGSGGGHLDEHIPGLVKTDLLPLPFVDVVCAAESLPFENSSVAAIYMINVLHHVLEPRKFFQEATRVLKPGGIVVLIEPAVTPFSRVVYRYFHPEPFDPRALQWELDPSGPLSGGNDALPWIIFCRDRARFQQEFPKLEIEGLHPHTSVSRLLCGGVLMRSLLPNFCFPALIGFDHLSPSWMRRTISLFMTIVLRRST